MSDSNRREPNSRKASLTSFESHKRNSQVLRGGNQGEQSVADVARTALRAAGLDDEENMTEFPRDEKDEVMLLCNLSPNPTFRIYKKRNLLLA